MTGVITHFISDFGSFVFKDVCSCGGGRGFVAQPAHGEVGGGLVGAVAGTQVRANELIGLLFSCSSVLG